MAQPRNKKLLVLVHPDSLCGSFRTSHGYAEDKLEKMYEELWNWEGTIVAIVGEFEDEISRYPYPQAMYAMVNEVYKASGNSDELSGAVARIASEFNLMCNSRNSSVNCKLVQITGIWREPGLGCVDHVAAEFKRLTEVPVKISNTAIYDDSYQHAKT